MAGNYPGLFGGIAELLENARRASARAVNEAMTATCLEMSRRIVEFFPVQSRPRVSI